MVQVKWGRTFCLVFIGVFAALTVFAEQATKIIKFMPDTPGRGVREGHCWTSSIAVTRPDAWRCMIGNEIIDPCFASADGKLVICDPNPAKGDPGFRLKLTEPLPKPDFPVQSVADDSSWLVELADGTICRPVTGRSFEVQGKSANFYCENGQKDKEIVLLEGLNTKKPLWKAEKATIGHGPQGRKLLKSERLAVKTVWQ
ncbi:MAG: hypothetical protein ACLQJ7_09130 [Syntrophobacteraceae bacterium]